MSRQPSLGKQPKALPNENEKIVALRQQMLTQARPERWRCPCMLRQQTPPRTKQIKQIASTAVLSKRLAQTVPLPLQ